MNSANGMSQQVRTVADMIRRNAAEIPASPAVVGEGRNVTYGELGERSDRIASGLVSAGLRTGDRVAYLARNATEYWELFFGAAKAGVAVVPLNFRLAAGEIEWILADAEPAAILVEEHLAGLVPADYDGLRLVFSQAGTPAGKPGWVAVEEWLARQTPRDPHREAGGDGLLTLMYSSGTTGRPKGVTTTVEAMVWAVDAFGAQFGPSRDMVSLVPTPYYHIAAGGWSLISLNAGGQIVQFTEVTPANLLTQLVSHRATHVVMVPTLIQLFISSPEASAADYSSVRCLVYGGSPISETVMIRAHEVFGADLAQSYGLTETIGRHYHPAAVGPRRGQRQPAAVRGPRGAWHRDQDRRPGDRRRHPRRRGRRDLHPRALGDRRLLAAAEGDSGVVLARRLVQDGRRRLPGRRRLRVHHGPHQGPADVRR